MFYLFLTYLQLKYFFIIKSFLDYKNFEKYVSSANTVTMKDNTFATIRKSMYNVKA